MYICIIFIKFEHIGKSNFNQIGRSCLYLVFFPQCGVFPVKPLVSVAFKSRPNSFYYVIPALMLFLICVYKYICFQIKTVIATYGSIFAVSVIDKFMVMFCWCVSAGILPTYCWWYFIYVFLLVSLLQSRKCY